jgi:hypothetical protein
MLTLLTYPAKKVIFLPRKLQYVLIIRPMY